WHFRQSFGPSESARRQPFRTGAEAAPGSPDASDRGGAAVIDPVTQAVLQRIIRREGRSLLQYVSESFPWTAPGENGAVVRLREIAAEENNSTAALVRYVSKRR